MPTQFSLGMIIVGAFEGALILGGLGLLWRFQFSPEARERLRGPLPLGRWNISLSMFMQIVLCVICGGVLFQLGLAQLLHKSLADGDTLCLQRLRDQVAHAVASISHRGSPFLLSSVIFQ